MITFRQPFEGSYPITQSFGEVIDGVTYKNKPHTGVDYGCPSGTEILASADGTVIKVGYEKNGYGNYVIILHGDGSGTLYAHLHKVYTYQGAKVKQGDPIGLSGATGYVTGPHLHFEYRREADKNDTAEDPVAHLQSVLDADPNKYTPEPEQRKFDSVHDGICIVVCDVANVRCHCDMTRVIDSLKKGSVIVIGNKVTMYNGLPYRDYYDPRHNCWLRIAEHDNWDQILRNYYTVEAEDGTR